MGLPTYHASDGRHQVVVGSSSSDFIEVAGRSVRTLHAVLPDDRHGLRFLIQRYEVGEEQLESGRDYCFLYTDLANPTSNRIYTNIGYERVCDSTDYAFEDRSRSR